MPCSPLTAEISSSWVRRYDSNLRIDCHRLIICVGAGTGIVALTVGALRSSIDPVHIGKIVTTDLRTFYVSSCP
jgi:hypothetical protein